MNQLILSNKEIAANYSDCNTLSDLISKIEKKGWTEGQVICGITLNGMKLSEGDEQKLQASAATDINEIHFQLNNINSVVESTVSSILEWFPAGVEGTLLTSELLRAGDEIKAFEVFTQVVESCCWVSDSLHLLKTMCDKKIKEKDLLQRWDSSEVKLKSDIENLISSIKSKNYQLTADLLEYELVESLQEWSSILKLLI